VTFTLVPKLGLGAIVDLILIFELGFAQLGELNVEADSIARNILGPFLAVIIVVLMNLTLPETLIL
jgi:hypothetical protein